MSNIAKGHVERLNQKPDISLMIYYIAWPQGVLELFSKYYSVKSLA